MKMTPLIALLVTGFVLPLQAYQVKNQLPTKKVTITELTYYYASSTVTEDVNVILDPNEQFAESASCGATSASFKAKVGKKNYNINGLGCNSVVTFLNAGGEVTFTIDQN